MLVWMALGTTEFMVLGLALDQQIKLFFMASAADLGWNVILIGNFKGHMGLMTQFAIRLSHIRGMGFVALQAFKYLAMLVVTVGTAKVAVETLVRIKLLTLSFMAGKAGLSNLPGQIETQRRVRVRVAPQAPFQLKVRLTRVALTASGDYTLHNLRRMALMTIKASHLGFMRAARLLNVLCCVSVAFDTLFVCQLYWNNFFGLFFSC
jgi:hypothetical protein